MVATTDKKAAAEKKPAKGKEDSKKLPAVPESVLKHRKRREALRTRRLQVYYPSSYPIASQLAVCYNTWI